MLSPLIVIFAERAIVYHDIRGIYLRRHKPGTEIPPFSLVFRVATEFGLRRVAAITMVDSTQPRVAEPVADDVMECLVCYLYTESAAKLALSEAIRVLARLYGHTPHGQSIMTLGTLEFDGRDDWLAAQATGAVEGREHRVIELDTPAPVDVEYSPPADPPPMETSAGYFTGPVSEYDGITPNQSLLRRLVNAMQAFAAMPVSGTRGSFAFNELGSALHDVRGIFGEEAVVAAALECGFDMATIDFLLQQPSASGTTPPATNAAILRGLADAYDAGMVGASTITEALEAHTASLEEESGASAAVGTARDPEEWTTPNALQMTRRIQDRAAGREAAESDRMMSVRAAMVTARTEAMNRDAIQGNLTGRELMFRQLADAMILYMERVEAGHGADSCGHALVRILREMLSAYGPNEPVQTADRYGVDLRDVLSSLAEYAFIRFDIRWLNATGVVTGNLSMILRDWYAREQAVPAANLDLTAAELAAIDAERTRTESMNQEGLALAVLHTRRLSIASTMYVDAIQHGAEDTIATCTILVQTIFDAQEAIGTAAVRQIAADQPLNVMLAWIIYQTTNMGASTDYTLQLQQDARDSGMSDSTAVAVLAVIDAERTRQGQADASDDEPPSNSSLLAMFD